MTGFPSSLRLGRERQRVLFLALAAVYTNPATPSALRSLPDLRPSTFAPALCQLPPCPGLGFLLLSQVSAQGHCLREAFPDRSG